MHRFQIFKSYNFKRYYLMSMLNMLTNKAFINKILSFMNGNSSYN